MIYRVLGELEIGGDGESVELPGGHALVVLAALLMNANQRMSKAELLAAAWGGAEVSEAQLHKAVSTLRALLEKIGRQADLVTYARYGYELRVPEYELDMLVFRRLLVQAEQARPERHVDDEISLLRMALGLWRGQRPLSNVPSNAFGNEADGLEQRRKRAAARLFDLELTRGAYEGALDDLAMISRYYPEDGRLAEQLMIASYRCGHVTDATAAFERHADALAEQTGGNPDPALRDLHYAIASGEEQVVAAAEAGIARRAGLPGAVRSVPVPRQLPPDLDQITFGQAYALILAADHFSDPDLASLRSPAKNAVDLAAILAYEAIGSFDVEVAINEQSHEWRRRIARFSDSRRTEDFLVLYVATHGITDPYGQLHFAASDTDPGLLSATGVSADFVAQQLNRSPAEKILLLLDCCFSSAYGHTRRFTSGGQARVQELGRHGRAVITSNSTFEYAFDLFSGQVTGRPAPSIMTAAIIDGLSTGKADRDGDGLISVKELYDYLVERAHAMTPRQTPELILSGSSEFMVARNPRAPASQQGHRTGAVTAPNSSVISPASSYGHDDGQSDEDALAYWDDVVDALRDGQDSHNLAKALSEAALLLTRLRHPDRALLSYEESAAIYRDLGDSEGELETLISLIAVYDALGQADDSAAAASRVTVIRRALR